MTDAAQTTPPTDPWWLGELSEIMTDGPRAVQVRWATRQAAGCALAEIEQLRALVTRLTDVAQNLAAELRDPGADAMAAIYCGRHFIYG